MLAGPTRRPAVTLAVTAGAFFLVLLDTTIVSVALPTLRRDLAVPLSSLGWVVTAYTLPFACLLLPFGTIGDRYGRGRIFGVGVLAFTAGSLVCGLAPSLGVLLAGRVVQGVGGAALGPASLALLALAYPEERARARALGVWSAVTGAALPLGPLTGGLLLRLTGDWRSVFAVTVPVGLLLLLAVPLVREPGPAPRRSAAAPLDIAGMLLSASALAALVWGLSEGSAAGWSESRVRIALAVSLALGAAFLARQSGIPAPLLPLRLFRDPLFSVASLGALAAGGVLTTTTFFLAQYFQDVQQHSPLGAGLRTLPLTLGIALAAPVAGRLSARAGHRVPVGVGLGLAGLAELALVRLAPDTRYAAAGVVLAALGVGFGLALSPLVGATLASAPRELLGVASGTNTVARQLGGSLGIALLSGLVSRRSRSPAPGGEGAAFTDALHAAFAVNSLLAIGAAVLCVAFLRPRPPSLSPSPSPSPTRSA